MARPPPHIRADHQIVQWISGSVTPTFGRIVVSTADSVTSEVSRAIESFSEIASSGRSILASHGHKDTKKSFYIFQSFVRQSLTFFSAAQQLHHRASPLLYYYSFLNMAKAICYLKDPNFSTGKMFHGLSDVATSNTLQQSKIKFIHNGVFGEFYRHLFGLQFSFNSDISIRTLMGYITDSMWEYMKFNYGFPRCVMVTMLVTRDVVEREFRASLALPGGVGTHRDIKNQIQRDFELVNLNPNSRQAFGHTAETSAGYVYWRSKKSFLPDNINIIPVTEVVDYVRATLGANVSDVIYKDDGTFFLNCPLEKTNTTPMNEFVAIYMVMFLLGSLVRYRPGVLENMLEKTDAWMIESLTRTTPVAFLKHARNAIAGDRVIYVSR